MVCLGNICINTLYKGAKNDDDDDDDDNDNDNNNNNNSATLTEVFPCFFLSCEANARVNQGKRLGTASTLPDLLFVLFFVCYSCCFVVNCDVLCTVCV
jgi:hypothetical protein